MTMKAGPGRTISAMPIASTVSPITSTISRRACRMPRAARSRVRRTGLISGEQYLSHGAAQHLALSGLFPAGVWRVAFQEAANGALERGRVVEHHVMVSIGDLDCLSMPGRA